MGVDSSGDHHRFALLADSPKRSSTFSGASPKETSDNLRRTIAIASVLREAAAFIVVHGWSAHPSLQAPQPAPRGHKIPKVQHGRMISRVESCPRIIGLVGIEADVHVRVCVLPTCCRANSFSE